MDTDERVASQNIAVKLVEPHSGVTDTAFGERSTKDNWADPVLSDYAEFQTRTQRAADILAARSISAAEVAEVIYQAATDGSDRLRYLVGNDTRGFIKARHEMGDLDYVAFMRSRFVAEE